MSDQRPPTAEELRQQEIARARLKEFFWLERSRDRRLEQRITGERA